MKKLLSIFLVAGTVSSLAACGKKAQPTTETPDNAVVEAKEA